MTPWDRHRQQYPDRWIGLIPAEIKRAEALARRRHLGSIAHGLKDNLNDRNFQKDVTGVYGEFGAARYLGYPEPTSVHAYEKPDLGERVGVRCREKWYFELPVKPTKDSSAFFFLLTTRVGIHIAIRGWLEGDLAKTVPLSDPGNRNKPVHLVPISMLKDPESLRAYCYRERGEEWNP